MQSSQRSATAMASAISSLVLVSSAFGASAACDTAAKAFMTSGIDWRRSRKCGDRSLVISGQSVMGLSPVSRHVFRHSSGGGAGRLELNQGHKSRAQLHTSPVKGDRLYAVQCRAKQKAPALPPEPFVFVPA